MKYSATATTTVGGRLPSKDSLISTTEANRQQQHGNGPPSATAVGDSAVVRARYEPDVGGVNRYKHSHSVHQQERSANANGGGGGDVAESIDKSPSPRMKHRNAQPLVFAKQTFNPDSLPSLFNPNPNGNGNGGPSTTTRTANVETWRIRRRRRPSREEDPAIARISEAVAHKARLIDTPTNVLPPIPRSLGVQPAIHAQLSPPSIGGVQSGSSPTNGIDGAGSLMRLLRSPTMKVSPEVSIVTPIKTVSGVSAFGDRSRLIQQQPSQYRFVPPMPTGTATMTTVRTPNGIIPSLAPTELTSAPAPLVKRTHALTAVAPPPPPSNGHNKEGQAVEQRVKPKKAPKQRGGVEFGTQTDVDYSQQPLRSDPSMEHSPTTTTSTSTSTGPTAERSTPKATQTDRRPFQSEMDLRRESSELEQRSELMQIIEGALGETIDKASRIRASQLIASSAQKQAQIWKEAKFFLSTVLLPCSIELANMTRSIELSQQRIANIQLP